MLNRMGEVSLFRRKFFFAYASQFINGLNELLSYHFYLFFYS
jgi:hypothetical protein